jgi:hypothetical protein
MGDLAHRPIAPVVHHLFSSFCPLFSYHWLEILVPVVVPVERRKWAKLGELHGKQKTDEALGGQG